MIRGEIWLINLDPTVGAEINKSRPAVVVNRDSIGKLPLKIIVPITEWVDRYAQAAWHVRISPSKSNGLNKESSADVFQVRSVSQTRFIHRIGKLPKSTIDEIELALKICLHLD